MPYTPTLMMGFCSIGTTKTAHGIDFMHKLLTAAFCFVAASVFAANPDFRNFNTNQFGTNGLNITVRSGAKMTNIVLEGVATGNAGGLTNVLARFGIDSLAHANVINVTNHGVVPYIPPNFAVGVFPTNATDNSVALSNVMRFASNAIAPKIVYFPPGIYRFTNTLTIPPLTHIVGEGHFHHGSTGTPDITGTGTGATNRASILWWAGSTNGTAVRAPYTSQGPQWFSNFEICGFTNPIASLGQGFSAGTIETSSSTNFGFMGINFDNGVFCGAQVVSDVSICGFRIGINHAGNACSYIRCELGGNDIGFLQTNTFAVDGVLLQQVATGNRQGGVGLFITASRGFIIDRPTDIDGYVYAIINKSSATVLGGNVELNSTVPPVWTFFQATTGGVNTWYASNSWPYLKKGFIMANLLLHPSDNSTAGSINLIGGQYSDGPSKMDALIVDQSKTTSAGFNFNVENVNWSSTNAAVYDGYNVVLAGEAYRSDISYIGNTANPAAIVQQWGSFTFADPKYTFSTGKSSEVGNQLWQLNYGEYVNGTLPPYLTNHTAGRFALPEYQFGTTTTPDWEQVLMATNWTAAGLPNRAYVRRIWSDPGGLTPGGEPNTNITVEVVRWRTGTNLGTSYIPTNTAPYAITTNNFVLNAFNTNANQRAYISASIFLANSAGGADVAKVNLYLDQDANGTFEQTGIEVQNTELSVLGSTFQLGAYLQPGARFMFTNTSTAGATGVSIVAGSCQRVTQ